MRGLQDGQMLHSYKDIIVTIATKESGLYLLYGDEKMGLDIKTNCTN